MKIVEPIKSYEKIQEIKQYLEEEWSYRDLLLFTSGINFALRIGDLLKLKVRDLIHDDWNIKSYFYLKEEKTKKSNKIFVTENVNYILNKYIISYKDIIKDKNNYLFFWKKTYPLWSKPITRRQGLNLVSKCTKHVWLTSNYWSHTLRKTWGYHARKQDISILIIQAKLNHSSPKIIERYLWITSDEIEEACNKLNL